MRHPIGNFAWVEAIERWQALDIPITSGTNFNVYVPWADELPPFVEGFRHALSQWTMTAPPIRRAYEARYRVDEAKNSADRLKVADFMVNLFYTTSSRDTRGLMARSIEKATDLRLFTISDGRGGISGACALYIGHEIWGIYNVIVDEDHRHGGRGQALIAEMLAIANDSGRLIQLQCNSNLVDWYGYLGFKSHSCLHIYCV